MHECKLNNLSIWIKVFRVVFHVCSTWKVFDQFECENCLLFESDFWRRRSTLPTTGRRTMRSQIQAETFCAHMNVPCLFNYLFTFKSIDGLECIATCTTAGRRDSTTCLYSVPCAIDPHAHAVGQTISTASTGKLFIVSTISWWKMKLAKWVNKYASKIAGNVIIFDGENVFEKQNRN